MRPVLHTGEAVVVRLHGGAEMYGTVLAVDRRRNGLFYAVQAGADAINVRSERIVRTIDTTRLHRGVA